MSSGAEGLVFCLTHSPISGPELLSVSSLSALRFTFSNRALLFQFIGLSYYYLKWLMRVSAVSQRVLTGMNRDFVEMFFTVLTTSV